MAFVRDVIWTYQPDSTPYRRLQMQVHGRSNGTGALVCAPQEFVQPDVTRVADWRDDGAHRWVEITDPDDLDRLRALDSEDVRGDLAHRFAHTLLWRYVLYCDPQPSWFVERWLDDAAFYRGLSDAPSPDGHGPRRKGVS